MRYNIPYSDLTSLTQEERERFLEPDTPLCFGHSLEDQIGGQLRAGFVLTGYFDDNWDASKGAVHKHLPCYGATRAVKPL